MNRPGINIWFVVLATVPALSASAQSQSCPININFSAGALNHWEAYTGNNQGGNGASAIKLTYDSSLQAPHGTIGATDFPEYNLPGVSGIQVITSQSIDPFGSFQTIPTINGYAYHYSILLGSTSVTNHQTSDPTNGSPGNPGGAPQGGASQGGYVRGISYVINVPPGSSSVPYTMTYAYAMVLENGTHPSLEQPMARAIVSTPGGVIACASPEYYLATNGGGLDSATARANGFSPSPMPTPNASPNPQNSGQHLQDVWTKGWTEVTFDLSAYRGQQVTLTFEADNCVPGGHFAYAYFAIRDVCAGLGISGDTIACSNSKEKFSIPSLDSASYDWSAPIGWAIESGSDGNTITVKVGPQPGWIVARERNSCTSLTDSLFVQLYKGALPQAVLDPPDTTICIGGKAPLQALVTTGTAYSWVSQGPFTGGNKGTIPALPFDADIVAAPDQTADYILSLQNDGCPITVLDTFLVTVVPLIRLNLPSDTLVVTNEPLHFQATSTDPYPDEYQWTPSTGLNNPDIPNPTGTYESDITNLSYQVKATDTFGCYGTATVNITVAHTLPDIFVPNAFTPGANSNSIFRPVCMGISSLEFFRVFNRWGQLLFSTSRMEQGWDGRIQGQLQESSTYMWILKGTDYTGKVIIKKGTVVLVR
jgi:gliding motility-associated-like protein